MTQTSRWRPKNVVHDSKKYQRSNRPAAVSHNQFVNRPSVASKIVVPESSTFHRKQNVQQQTSQNIQLNTKKNDFGQKINDGGLLAIKALQAIHSSHMGSSNSQRDLQEANSSVPCTSLVHTKRRITQKMSEMTLERDSGNSSPTELAVNNEVSSFPTILKVSQNLMK